MRKNMLLSIVAAVGFLSASTSVSADSHPAIVAPGYDLLHTLEAQLFNPNGNPNPLFLQPVLLNTYDFGFGPVDVGDADTIIRRLDAAVVAFDANMFPSAPVRVDIEMVALQLRSDGPVSLFGSPTLQFYFTESQSRVSGGWMDITFDSYNHGTFSTFLDVWVDVRIGALDGQLVGEINKQFVVVVHEWWRTPPPGAVEIDFINRYHRGFGDRSWDFWPLFIGQGIIHDDGQGSNHIVRVAFVPEPATWAMLIVGFGFVGSALRRRRALAGTMVS